MNDNLKDFLQKTNIQEKISAKDIESILSLNKTQEINNLYNEAYLIKKKEVSNTVYFRGLIELSNICNKDCYYCGIRKSNKKVKRYMISENEVLKAAKWAFEHRYASIVLQSGERNDDEFISFVENILKKIKKISNNKLGITISLGEHSLETYKRWFEAGAHRYLLRIETSNQKLYNKLHPKNHSFENRIDCLKKIKKIGYQTGTGVMIGLPGQTTLDLANDLLFFKEMDIDMIGMGPYIPHNETPINNIAQGKMIPKEKRLELSLKMIAIARILLKNINIAATTALETISDTGKELGLKAGANVLMPNITDIKYRSSYKLYDGKPCLAEDNSHYQHYLENRIQAIGEKIGYDKWGDSLHYKAYFATASTNI